MNLAKNITYSGYIGHYISDTGHLLLTLPTLNHLNHYLDMFRALMTLSKETDYVLGINFIDLDALDELAQPFGIACDDRYHALVFSSDQHMMAYRLMENG